MPYIDLLLLNHCNFFPHEFIDLLLVWLLHIGIISIILMILTKKSRQMDLFFCLLIFWILNRFLLFLDIVNLILLLIGFFFFFLNRIHIIIYGFLLVFLTNYILLIIFSVFYFFIFLCRSLFGIWWNSFFSLWYRCLFINHCFLYFLFRLFFSNFWKWIFIQVNEFWSFAKLFRNNLFMAVRNFFRLKPDITTASTFSFLESNRTFLVVRTRSTLLKISIVKLSRVANFYLF